MAKTILGYVWVLLVAAGLMGCEESSREDAAAPPEPPVPPAVHCRRSEITRITLRCDVVGMGAGHTTWYATGAVDGGHVSGGSATMERRQLDEASIAQIWAAAEDLLPRYRGVHQASDPNWGRYFSLFMTLQDGSSVTIRWQEEPPADVKQLTDLLSKQ